MRVRTTLSVAILCVSLGVSYSEAAQKKGKKRQPAAPKTMAAPLTNNSEVKAVIQQDSIEAAINWVRTQKANYEQRHVFYFDTANLDLQKSGISLRLRRKQDDSYESTVKIRLEDLKEIPNYSGKSAKKLSCEMDLQMELEDKKSCSVTRKEKKTLPSVNVDNPDGFFDNDQEKMIKHFHSEFKYSKLKSFGRINSVVWDLDDNTDGDMSFEVWTLPNGQRIAEFSMRSLMTDADKATATLAKKISDWGFKIDKSAKFKTEMALQSLSAEIQTKP